MTGKVCALASGRTGAGESECPGRCSGRTDWLLPNSPPWSKYSHWQGSAAWCWTESSTEQKATCLNCYGSFCHSSAGSKS